MINVGVEGKQILLDPLWSCCQAGIVVLYREANLDAPDLDGDADSIGTETSM
jgi:hypothetical protein